MQEIKKRAKRRQTVSLSSTRRAALLTLKEMMAAGCDFRVRKKQFLASRTYCFNFLLREGYGSRAIGASFLDEAYVNQAYTLAPNFNFAECKKDKGGDEKDEEEDLPSDEGEEPSEAEDNSSESDSSSSA